MGEIIINHGAWGTSIGWYDRYIKDLQIAYGNDYISKIGIKNIVFNDPATIVLWKDGTKTVVKVQPGDKYNPETGLAMCIVKKMAGNKGNYNKIFEKWLPKERKE